jgi:preprotein translocase subunit YajC
VKFNESRTLFFTSDSNVEKKKVTIWISLVTLKKKKLCGALCDTFLSANEEDYTPLKRHVLVCFFFYFIMCPPSDKRKKKKSCHHVKSENVTSLIYMTLDFFFAPFVFRRQQSLASNDNDLCENIKFHNFFHELILCHFCLFFFQVHQHHYICKTKFFLFKM